MPQELPDEALRPRQERLPPVPEFLLLPEPEVQALPQELSGLLLPDLLLREPLLLEA